jgi:hypothetical protein
VTCRQAPWFLAALLVGSVAGCGGGDQPRAINDVQSDAHFYSSHDLGHTITVRGVVTQLPAAGTLVLSPGPDPRGEHLIVLTSEPGPVTVGQWVTVSGTVGQLHSTPPESRLPYLQEDLYTPEETHIYLYGARVEES